MRTHLNERRKRTLLATPQRAMMCDGAHVRPTAEQVSRGRSARDVLASPITRSRPLEWRETTEGELGLPHFWQNGNAWVPANGGNALVTLVPSTAQLWQ